VTDHAARNQIEIDVAVLAPAEPGQPRAIISLGEAKWGDVMGVRHIARLQRAQSVLESKGFDVSRTILACYSGGGFDAEIQELAGRQESVGPDGTARSRILLAGLDTIYG
jgi:hypothetical protein